MIEDGDSGAAVVILDAQVDLNTVALTIIADGRLAIAHPGSKHTCHQDGPHPEEAITCATIVAR